MKHNQTKTPIVFFTLMLMLTGTLAASVFSAQVNAQSAGSIVINNGAAYTNSTTLALTLSSSNAVQMRFSSDNSSWSDWQNYATSQNWTLTDGDGNYTVYAQFQDNANSISSANASIVLDTTPPQPAPYADWYTNDYRTVYFDASYSTDNFGIANYTWNFGDGNITSGINVIHVYAAAGNYTVSLTVKDYAGNTANQTFPAVIPDLSSLPTPTPTPPVSTVPPTSNPTTQPTATPTEIPTSNALNSAWTLALIAIVVIVIIGAVMILVLRTRSKPVPSAP
jgi:PKD repeat protein